MLLLYVACTTPQKTYFKLGDKRLSGMLLISPECYAHSHKTDLEDEAYTVRPSGEGGGEEMSRHTRARASRSRRLKADCPCLLLRRILYPGYRHVFDWANNEALASALRLAAGFPQPGCLPGCGPQQGAVRPEAPRHDAHL